MHLGDGNGEVHIYCIYFESESQIGTHPTGYGQLFLVMNGEGWVAGSDGHRIQLKAGLGAFFEPGELPTALSPLYIWGKLQFVCHFSIRMAF